MRLALLFPLFLCLSLCLPATGRGADIFVPGDHSTIQGAIDAAAAGDTIIVRPGVYFENIDFSGKAVTVRSERGPSFTVIDGGGAGSVVVFRHGEGPDAAIEGFTVTGGFAPFGGGIYCLDASPTITGNIVRENETKYDGGGMACHGASFPFVTSTFFIANKARKGGAIECRDGAAPTITNDTLTENSAANAGGGIYCRAGAAPLLANAVLWENEAPKGPQIAIGTASDPATLSISYSDLEGGAGSVHVDAGCTLDFGTNMIDDDPLFYETAAGDYHHPYYSPCRNSGDDFAPGVPAKDFEGDKRIFCGRIDMGADEFYPHLYYTGDMIPGAEIFIRVTAPPYVPVVLFKGDGIQDPPQNTPYGDLYLTLPFANRWRLPNMPERGIRKIRTTVPLAWAAGEEHYYQAWVGRAGAYDPMFTNLEIASVK